ncbi:cell division protein FtsQ/DivIB [Pokkaliibacter sp. CJK22405]|uniref:cell division protein FtsQ/DivIB n=1 Tax=Pokkaliibacter sp. CJK22405 TaxID=3384615 RepID=UPI003984F1F5
MMPMIRSPQLRGPGRPRGATRVAPVAKRKTRSLPWKQWLMWTSNTVLLTALVIGSGLGYEKAKAWLDRPVREIALQGDIHHVDSAFISQELQQEVTGTFFDLDLDHIRQLVEQDPWVDHAEVHRSWPDKVIINIEEALPVARWGDQALIDSAGRIFTPDAAQMTEYQSLPELVGPKDQVHDVMRYFSTLSQQLKSMGFTVQNLLLEERGAWTLQMVDESGLPLRLLLGREDLQSRLARFSTIYEAALKPRLAQIEQIDARHANGVAVRWKTAENGQKG